MAIVKWAGMVSYLAWSSGYLASEATQLVEALAGLVEAALRDGLRWAVEPAAHLASFALLIDHPASGQLCVTIEGATDDPRIPEGERLNLSIFLCGRAAALTDMAAADRAKQILAAYGERLLPQQELQLQTPLYSGHPVALRDVLPHIVSLVREHNQMLRQRAVDITSRFLAQGGLYEVVHALVHELATSNFVDEALALLGAWMDVSPARIRQSPVVFLFRARLGATFCTSRSSVTAQGFSSQDELVQLANEVFGDVVVDRDSPWAPLRVPDRPGVPAYAREEDFEKALQRALDPAAAASLITDTKPPPTAIVNLFWDRVPISHMLQQGGAPALPICLSFEEPAPDRPLKNVVVWVGNVTFAEEEASGVATIFESAGCSVETVRAAEVDKKALLSRYEDGAVDVLWVSSHAEFGAGPPEKTRLVLADDLELTLKELLDHAPDRNGSRRLLVLNACNGAAVRGLGGPSRLGLAAGLCYSEQAVVSHLWPIGFQEAAAFGVLLALQLSTSPAYFEAFERATDAFGNAPESVATTLGDIGCGDAVIDFVARPLGFLRRTSPTFFE